MDIQHPISALIPTLEGLVVEALNRSSEPVGITRIHERAGSGSLSGIKKAVSRLVDTGVVLAQGSPPRYSLNREHITYPAVAALTSARAELLDRIAALARTWDPLPGLVGVFGSFARGEGDMDSDIDVLVVGDVSDDAISGLASAIERWTGNRSHVLQLSTHEYRRAKASEAIGAEWERDLITLVEAT